MTDTERKLTWICFHYYSPSFYLQSNTDNSAFLLFRAASVMKGRQTSREHQHVHVASFHLSQHDPIAPLPRADETKNAMSLINPIIHIYTYILCTFTYYFLIISIKLYSARGPLNVCICLQVCIWSEKTYPYIIYKNAAFQYFVFLFKDGRWSTHYSSDIPSIFRYNFFSYNYSLIKKKKRITPNILTLKIRRFSYIFI